MQGSSKSAEGYLSRVARGRAKRRLEYILGELEDLHNLHHDFTDEEGDDLTTAVDALQHMGRSLAKTARK